MSVSPTVVRPPASQSLIGERLRRLFSSIAVIGFTALALGTAAGFLLGHWTGFDHGAAQRRLQPNGSILCKPGPWGDLSYTPFTIAAPDDLLPVRTWEAKGTHWFFKGYTADSFTGLLQSTSLTAEQQRALIDPGVLSVRTDGIYLSPSPESLLSLPDDARAKLYEVLAQIPENESQLYLVHKDIVDEQLTSPGLAPNALALFKHLSYQSGDYSLFSGLSALLSRLSSPEEKLHFVKAITSQRTMLLRLHITPKSDLADLIGYWGKGSWNTDVGTIMQSLSTIHSGTWMNILMALPPLANKELYQYPTDLDDPLDGPLVNRDSAWSSLNFFRDVPEPNFGKPDEALEELKENYSLAPADPRYGDVVLLSKPDGTIVHSAVYIADDICFTKNGSTVVDPWMLVTISDLIERYSFRVSPGQLLLVSYFRNKRL